MKFLLLSLTVGTVLLLSNPLLATEKNIQYNYGEFRIIIDAELDDTNVDGDGFGFGGSLRLDELFYLIVDYESIEYDLNIDTTDLQLGTGIIFSTDRFDTVAEFAVLDRDVDNASGGDTGFRLSAGVRGYVTPNFELRATFNFVDVDNNDDTFVTFGGDYFLSQSFSVNFSNDFSADIERFSVGIRYYLGE